MSNGRFFLAALVLACASCARVELIKPTLAPQPRVVVVDTVFVEASAEGAADVASRPIVPARDTAFSDAELQAVIDSAAPEPFVDDALPALSIDPYANHQRVEHYLNLFAGEARDRIGERLTRGTRFDDLIRARLRVGGIPEDFVYLALIESGYDPHAYSAAAAVGMWQFMSSTARGVGLRVDWWIDERRDPVRATDAAIVYLNQLRAQFGSLYLAAAAYNGGPGRVSRSLSQLAAELEDDEPEDRFFTLASTNLLRAETRNYVPQLIAAALIGRDPAAYGIRVDTLPDFVFDSVSVPANTGLDAVARVCGTETRDIVDMNGQVLRGMTPPTGSPVWLRVPPGCAEWFDESFAALDAAARAGAVRHVAKKGDTPAKLAGSAGVTVTVLRRYNPALKTANSSAISAGTVVWLPDAETVRASRDVPDPSIERYGVATGPTYLVRRGDTLSGIAQRHGTTVARLKSLNALTSDRIVAGQRIRVRS